MEKIKVCHICNLTMNGKAIFLCNLLENTDYEKYEVTVINYRANSAVSVSSRLQRLPVKIVNPPKGNEFVFCIFLNNYFKYNKFDICHSHIWDQSGLFLAVAHHKGIPIRVAHSHNTSKANERYNRVKVLIRDKIIWNILLCMIKIHGNRYIACSEEAAKWLFVPSIINNKRYVVVPNGIKLEKFSFPNRKKHNPTEILFAGRFIYQKNPLFAIYCFAEFLKITPNAHMTMIGKGDMDADVQAEIKKLHLSDQIDIVPETDDMPKYYKAADIFLFPSYYEGLGIALIEAQASGLKCLASDTVPKESQCGLVRYEPLSAGAGQWARFIFGLLHDDKLNISKTLLNHYDIKNTVKLIEEAYQLKKA